MSDGGKLENRDWIKELFYIGDNEVRSWRNMTITVTSPSTS